MMGIHIIAIKMQYSIIKDVMSHKWLSLSPKSTIVQEDF